MVIYIAIFFIILVLSLIELSYNKPIKGQYKVLLSLCIVLFLMVGLRGIGYDYDSYRRIYMLARGGLAPKGIDPGFDILCSVIPSFRMLLLFMSAITFIPLYRVIKNKSDYCFLSLLLFSTTFLFPTVMGQMRQGVTIFVMCYAYFRWRDNKVVFLSLWVLCCTLHTSALLAIVLLVPVKRLFPLYVYIGLIVIALVINSALSSIFAPFLNGLSMLEDTNVSDKLNYYNTTETEMGVSLGFNTAVVIRCFVVIMTYFFLKRTSRDNASVLNLYFLSIFIYLSLSFIPQIGGRGSQYFSVLDLILIPHLIKEYRGFWRMSMIVLFIGLSVLRFGQFFKDDYNRQCYVPYKIELK